MISHEVAGTKSGWKGSEELITYTVERGTRHQLTHIGFSGNHYFGTDLLKSRLTISTTSLFTHPRFSRRLMESDALSMKNLYISNGFLSATVDAQVTEEKGEEWRPERRLQYHRGEADSRLKSPGGGRASAFR